MTVTVIHFPSKKTSGSGSKRFQTGRPRRATLHHPRIEKTRNSLRDQYSFVLAAGIHPLISDELCQRHLVLLLREQIILHMISLEIRGGIFQRL